MAICKNCGEDFDVPTVRAAYDEMLDGEGDYDTDDGGDRCLDCSLPDHVAGALAHGQAIMMVNGEMDYDEEHVENHL
ncbi:hypothetical protein [Janibacter sp. UYMM211]|uniref:hypothetical protein n=1 Tax=Janibacter sp. UYMM211 TaxID=3156342 RepID=UPI0033986A42